MGEILPRFKLWFKNPRYEALFKLYYSKNYGLKIQGEALGTVWRGASKG